MRSLIKVLLILTVLAVAPSVFAQMVGDDSTLVFNMQGISDGCGATMNADECMFGDSSWTTTLCTMAACPACAFADVAGTRSTCYYLTGNMGYCSCKGAGVAYDRNGNKYANCVTNGSCVSHR